MIGDGGIWAAYGRRMILFGWERFRVNSTAPLHALGFSVYEPTSTSSTGCNTTCVDTTFVIKLYSGATQVGDDILLSPANNQWVFWGIRSDVPFDRVSIFDQNDDNEFFASFLYADTPPVALKLSSGVVAGCKSLGGTVSLPGPASSDTVVSLADNLAGASTPASVTIPAGSSMVKFPVSTVPVETDQIGKVSATLGGLTVSEDLTVRRIGVKSLSYRPSKLLGSDDGRGTVKLDCAAAPGAIDVDLASSKPEIAGPLQVMINIPAGASSGSFDIRSNQVFTNSKAPISAEANGIRKTKSLSVVPIVSVGPTRLAFGNRDIGSTTVLSVAMLNNKNPELVNYDVAVSSIVVSGTQSAAYAQSNNCPAVLGNGESCTIEVSFTPTAEGSRSAKLLISTNATSSPLAVSLSGTGVATP